VTYVAVFAMPLKVLNIKEDSGQSESDYDSDYTKYAHVAMPKASHVDQSGSDVVSTPLSDTQRKLMLLAQELEEETVQHLSIQPRLNRLQPTKSLATLVPCISTSPVTANSSSAEAVCAPPVHGFGRRPSSPAIFKSKFETPPPPPPLSHCPPRLLQLHYQSRFNAERNFLLHQIQSFKDHVDVLVYNLRRAENNLTDKERQIAELTIRVKQLETQQVGQSSRKSSIASKASSSSEATESGLSSEMQNPTNADYTRQLSSLGSFVDIETMGAFHTEEMSMNKDEVIKDLQTQVIKGRRLSAAILAELERLYREK
jgi:hypothetical protein